MTDSSQIPETSDALSRNGYESNKVIDPENLLWNNKSNYDNYRELLKNYNNNYVSFIGAGVSIPLGIKDWKGLLDDLAKVAKEKYNFNQEIPADSEEWPVFAENIYNHLESNGAIEIYFDKISFGMNPRNNSTSLTLVKLARVNPIVS